MKNGGLAAVLSFFIPGVGQIYNGEMAKGGVMFVAGLVAGLFGMIPLIGLVLLVLLRLPLSLYSAWDANKVAEAINKGAKVKSGFGE